MNDPNDTMLSLEMPMNHPEKYLDPKLWHACAGAMARIPALNSNVYYFPQGYAEHAGITMDFHLFPQISPLVPCRVSSIKYLADPTDEVYVKIVLLPLQGSQSDLDNEETEKEKVNSFTKTLTQSDANNGGGFSVPRQCAESIFPRLDYSANRPSQTILAMDVQGRVWELTHVHRGSPKRHLLTTGWSVFVNHKKLVAGDSIVFLRDQDGGIRVGIRRARRAAIGASYMRSEAVVEAVSLASNGLPFEVVYYPRASTPEFVVGASRVRAAMRTRWCEGMKVKMAFEADSSRVSWVVGSVSSVREDDPIHWPNSPWKLLEVAWEEVDLVRNVKRVSPWLVELVSDIPAIHFSLKRPPVARGPTSEIPTVHLKRPRSSPEFLNLTLGTPMATSPLSSSPYNMHTDMQGARHDELADYECMYLRLGLPYKASSSSTTSSIPHRKNVKEPVIFLFGQPIFMENHENTGDASSSSVLIQNCEREASSDEEFSRLKDECKVVVESEDIARSLDLLSLSSYEDLYMKLDSMFGRLNISSNVVYSNAIGATKRVGEEPFGHFVKTARRLTIVKDSDSKDQGKKADHS